MKQLIAPIAIIVALFAFFVVIDRKDFYSSGDVAVQKEDVTRKPTSVTTLKPVEQPKETKPIAETKSVETKNVTETKPTTVKPIETKPVAETKPAEMKPTETKAVTEAKSAEAKPVAETKPTTVKPVETKPVAETKPVETKPMVETKPAETKPAEVKTSETKVVTEAKSVSETKPIVVKKLAPAAIPVVTAEEANKLNEEAIVYFKEVKEKREPFYSLYEKDKIESVWFEGTVVASSTIPDPKINDYDDCLYSLLIELESVLSKAASNSKPSREVLLNVPVMKSKAIITDNILYPGDKVLVKGSEYEKMTQNVQQIQLSDDIQSFEHQCYYALYVEKIKKFSLDGNKEFASREITIRPIQTLPKDEVAQKKRKERIQKEILRIEDEIRKHGGSFSEWKKEYASLADKYAKLCNDNFKGWIGDSYYAAAGHETTSYNTKAYLSGIIPYKEYLKERNIDLIIVRIPSKWDFAARVLASDTFQENPAWIENYYECLKNDIEIVDPMYEMWKARFDYPLFYFYQQDKESHPFEGMYLPTAKLLSEILSRYDFKKTDQISLGNAQFGSNAYKDERRYYPKGNNLFVENDEPRQLSFKCILFNGEEVGRLKTYSGSPFVFISNSYFGITYMQDKGASLPHYTSYYLKHMVDWKYQNGLGNNMLRILLSDQNALNNRKAVIMVGSWGSFGGGFSNIPKYLEGKSERIVLVKDIGIADILKSNNGSFESKQSNDILMFKAIQDSLSIDIDIPPMPEFKNCMIRLKVPRANGGVYASVKDLDNKIIDSLWFTIGTNIRCDLFIPASPESQRVSVVISPGDGYTFGLNAIELWGF